MAAKSIETDADVYHRLQAAYQKQCGQSPSSLIGKLNNLFEEELAIIRSRTRASKRDLISDKTLRNFFNSDKTPSLTEKNLNYLCRALLGCESYQDAIATSHLPATNDHLNEWIIPYLEHLESEHSTVRIPSMTEPTDLKAVYTQSQFAEELQFRKNKSVAELHAEMEPGYVPNQKGAEVFKIFDKFHRLMIWGAAGSGKTTNLKRYLIKIIDDLKNNLSSKQQLPVFIALREFSSDTIEFNLQNIIIEALSHGGLDELQIRKQTLSMLEEGQLIIMMDGLDEIPKALVATVQNEISNLVRGYPNNRFLLTCRYGTTDFVPLNFKEVEMTDFENNQVKKFVTQWFKADEDDKNLKKFFQHLKSKPQIKELTRNPLMLTLLCTIYEQGGEFPKGSSTLIEDATDLYLRKWDSYRRIDHRDDIYDGKLSRNRRRNLFCKLAFEGMSHAIEPKYFWKRNELELFIKDFIHNLPEVKDQSIDTDTMAIINALEAQDSLLMRVSSDAYTFSYRSFQEYFTAMSLTDKSGTDIETLKALIGDHVHEKEWKQSLIFVAERMPSTDAFLSYLFKLAIQELQQDRLKEVFEWLEDITDSAKVDSSSWRICFLTFDFKTDLYISRKVKNINEKVAQRIATKLRKMNQNAKLIKPRSPRAKLILDLAVIHALVKDRGEEISPSVMQMSMFDDTYRDAQQNIDVKFKDAVAEAHAIWPTLGEKLEKLLADFPSKNASSEHCNIWADRLRSTKFHQGESGTNIAIMLTDREVKALNHYLYLTELLIDCLSADIYCSKSLRERIINSLILAPDSEKIPSNLQLPLPDLQHI